MLKKRNTGKIQITGKTKIFFLHQSEVTCVMYTVLENVNVLWIMFKPAFHLTTHVIAAVTWVVLFAITPLAEMRISHQHKRQTLNIVGARCFMVYPEGKLIIFKNSRVSHVVHHFLEKTITPGLAAWIVHRVPPTTRSSKRFQVNCL